MHVCMGMCVGKFGMHVFQASSGLGLTLLWSSRWIVVKRQSRRQERRFCACKVCTNKQLYFLTLVYASALKACPADKVLTACERAQPLYVICILTLRNCPSRSDNQVPTSLQPTVWQLRKARGKMGKVFGSWPLCRAK